MRSKRVMRECGTKRRPHPQEHPRPTRPDALSAPPASRSPPSDSVVWARPTSTVPSEDAVSTALLQYALAGVEFFDTANMYGPWTNGSSAPRSAPAATRRSSPPSSASCAPKRAAPRRQGKPEYVHAAFDASLQRLGIDTIDLYYQHRVDANTPHRGRVGVASHSLRRGR